MVGRVFEYHVSLRPSGRLGLIGVIPGVGPLVTFISPFQMSNERSFRMICL